MKKGTCGKRPLKNDDGHIYPKVKKNVLERKQMDRKSGTPDWISKMRKNPPSIHYKGSGWTR